MQSHASTNCNQQLPINPMKHQSTAATAAPALVAIPAALLGAVSLRETPAVRGENRHLTREQLLAELRPGQDQRAALHMADPAPRTPRELAEWSAWVACHELGGSADDIKLVMPTHPAAAAFCAALPAFAPVRRPDRGSGNRRRASRRPRAAPRRARVSIATPGVGIGPTIITSMPTDTKPAARAGATDSSPTSQSPAVTSSPKATKVAP